MYIVTGGAGFIGSAFIAHLNQLGIDDILVVDSRPVFLYVNPKGEPRRWDRFNVVPSSTSEINLFKDIDGDGKPEVLFAGPGAVMAYAKPDPANPTAPWKVHNISAPGLAGAHGMGIGDINGDGFRDTWHIAKP